MEGTAAQKMSEKLGQLRDTHAHGGDVLQELGVAEGPPSAREEMGLGKGLEADPRIAGAPQTTPAGTPEADDPYKNAKEWEKPLSEQKRDAALEALESFKANDPYRTREGDPSNTYRDEADRLRDQVTHKFVKQEDLQDPDSVDVNSRPAEGEQGQEGTSGQAETDPGTSPATPEAGAEEAAFEVVIPPRPGQEHKEPLKLEVPTQQAADAVRRLVNDGMRRDQYNAEKAALAKDAQEREQFEQALREDPAGFLVGKLRDDHMVPLAKQLLAAMPQDAYKAIIQDLVQWEENPTDRAVFHTSHENERLKRENQRTQESMKAQREREKATAVLNAIDEIIPETMPETEWRNVFAFLRESLVSQMRQQGLNEVGPEQVRQLLTASGALRTVGLEGQVGASTTASQATTNGQPPAAPPEASVVGEGFRRRSEARRQATTVAPAGAGAGTLQGLRPPDGQGIADRLAWARKTLTGRV